MGKKKPKDNKLLALLLGTALLVSVRAPFVFAAEEGPQTTPDPQPETVEEQRPLIANGTSEDDVEPFLSIL